MGQGTLADVRAVALTLLVDRATVEVWQALRDAGIPAILLKGPSIASWLYDRVGARAYGDVDILVESAMLEKARRLLSRLGFQPRSPVVPGDRPRPSGAWLRPRDRATVDLHSTITGIGVPPEVAWRILRKQMEPVDVGGVSVWILSVPARAVHVALHALQHGPRHAKPMEDLRRAVSRLSIETWAEAAALAGTLEAVPAFAAGLRLAPEGARVADHLRLPRSSSRELTLRTRGAPTAALTVDWIMTKRDLPTSVSLLVRKLLPSPTFMRQWSPLARRGRAGLALAYLWRPLWLARQTGPAVVAWMRVRKEPP
jgi:Uncharacterised nucleotidyltransferase